MSKRRPSIVVEPAGPRVVLTFPYDPTLIATVRKTTGARYSQLEDGRKRWTVPRLALAEIVDVLGPSRLECDDAELNALIRNQVEIPEPIAVLPDLRERMQFPTYTQLNRPEAAFTADDFQATGTTWLINKRTGVLGDEIGMGKCKMILDAIDYLHHDGSCNVLILCKNSNVDTWFVEAKKFTPNFDVFMYRGTPKARAGIATDFLSATGINVLVMSYETFRNDVEDIANFSWDWIVADEAHKLKSSPMNGNQAKVAKEVHRLQAAHMFAVTANIIVNTAEDAWNPFTWLGIETRDWDTFEAETLVTRNISPSHYVTVKKVVNTKPEGMRKLRRLIVDNMIARHDKLDLPVKTYQDIRVTLKPEEARFYEAARAKYEYDNDGGLVSSPQLLNDLDFDDEAQNIPNVMVRQLRLKQITSSIGVFLSKPFVSSKVAAVKELVEDAVLSGRKVIVGTQFRSVLAQLEKELKEYNPAVVHGGVSAVGPARGLSPRGIQVQKFQDDPTCKVFLASVAACREGITITAGSVVIHVDKEWSPVYVEQFEGRAQRIGQKDHVLVYSLKAVMPDGSETVDFVIDDVLEGKDNDIKQLTR